MHNWSPFNISLISVLYYIFLHLFKTNYFDADDLFPLHLRSNQNVTGALVSLKTRFSLSRLEHPFIIFENPDTKCFIIFLPLVWRGQRAWGASWIASGPKSRRWALWRSLRWTGMPLKQRRALQTSWQSIIEAKKGMFKPH